MPENHTPSLTYLKRRRWTVEDAKQALEALKQSGLELSAFAARQGLDPQRLWRWRRQLRTLDTTAFHEVVRRDAVSPLEGEAMTATEREPFEVVLGSGRVCASPRRSTHRRSDSS